MKEDQERWNIRFSKRPLLNPNTPGFIESHYRQLIPGSVLDVASGDGAASLFLAAKGFTVTATDVSDVALERLVFFANKLKLEASTCLLDLDQPDGASHLGTFNNIVITHFKPEPNHWPFLVSLLRIGGKLMVSTFNQQHHTQNNFSQRFCLNKNELVNISDELKLEHHESVIRNSCYMDDYLFIREK